MKNQPNIQTPITLSNGGTGATDAIGARANLGAQEQSSLLSDIAGLNVSPGDLLYVNSSSQVERLPKGSEGQVLSLQGGSSYSQIWCTARKSSSSYPTGLLGFNFDSIGEFHAADDVGQMMKAA